MVTLTNSGNATMAISGISATGDFSQTNNCSTSLAPSAICTISVKFTPVAGGSRTGSLIVSDNSPGGPALATLSGQGSDFILAASGSGSASVQPGATATYQLAFTSTGGPFANQVTLACAGAPTPGTCSISPAKIPAGSSAAAVTVTVSTTSTAASLSQPHSGIGHSMLAAWIFQAPGFLLLGVISLGSTRRKLGWRYALLALMIGLGLFAIACGGGSTTPTKTATPQTDTTPGSYTIVVTANSGSLNHTLPLTLTVK
jgi:hypothetical protein